MSSPVIASALESQDIALLMQGYVLTLYESPSEDRQTVLAFLRGRMPQAGGNLELAECIAQSAYDYFAGIQDTQPWDLEREAVAGAYLGLVRNALSRDQPELAEQMADRACQHFWQGLPELGAAQRVRQEVSSRIERRRIGGRLGSQRRPVPGLAELAAQVRAKHSTADKRDSPGRELVPE